MRLILLNWRCKSHGLVIGRVAVWLKPGCLVGLEAMAFLCDTNIVKRDCVCV